MRACERERERKTLGITQLYIVNAKKVALFGAFIKLINFGCRSVWHNGVRTTFSWCHLENLVDFFHIIHMFVLLNFFLSFDLLFSLQFPGKRSRAIERERDRAKAFMNIFGVHEHP